MKLASKTSSLFRLIDASHQRMVYHVVSPSVSTVFRQLQDEHHWSQGSAEAKRYWLSVRLITPPTTMHFSADQSAHRSENTFEKLLGNHHLNLKMTTVWLVEMSATNNSPPLRTSNTRKAWLHQIQFSLREIMKIGTKWNTCTCICAFTGKVNQRAEKNSCLSLTCKM